MTEEATFPLLGAAFVILVVLPASALLSKLVLAAVDRFGGADRMHALGLRYVLLVAAPWVPLAWLLSAGLHQAESGRSAVACLLEHGNAGTCAEAAFFSLLLGTVTLALGFRRRISISTQSELGSLLRQRIARIIDRHESLAALHGRVHAVEGAMAGPIATVGWLRPRVLVETSFAERLDDAELAGALLHELEHVRGFDSSRYALLNLTLRVCPFGRLLLGKEAAQWVFAREAHCDREAVRRGAEATALAQALVHAARPVAIPAAALAEGGMASLRLRVNLLLSYAERSLTCDCRPSSMGGLRLVFAILLAASVLPHVSGTRPLDLIHNGSESILHRSGW